MHLLALPFRAKPKKRAVFWATRDASEEEVPPSFLEPLYRFYGKLLEYAVGLTAASRPKQAGADEYVRNYVAWGVSPRCAQHLIMGARAAALLEGRPAPEVQDVRDMALPVMRHRILPNYNALGEGLTAADIVAHLLDEVREPVAAR